MPKNVINAALTVLKKYAVFSKSNRDIFLFSLPFTPFLRPLSRGRIGRALFLKDNLDLKNRERAFEIISDLSLDRLDVILKSAKSLAKEKEDMDELFEWLFLLCRDIAVLDQTADTSHVINRDRVEDLKGLAGTIPVKAVYKIYDTVKNTQLLLKRNVNTQLALENMMIDVSSLKAGGSERQI